MAAMGVAVDRANIRERQAGASVAMTVTMLAIMA